MLNAKHTRIIALLLTAIMCISTPLCSMADEIGPGVGSSSSNNTGTGVTGQTGAPSTITDVAMPENLDLDSAVAGAGLSDLGGSNIVADPVLSIIPSLTYVFCNAGGGAMHLSKPTGSLEYEYNAGGFNKLHMEQNTSVGRLYYRVYNSTSGWSGWSNTDQITNTGSDGAVVQAVQIRIKGYMHKFADVYYKAVLNDGTVLDWAKNGQTMGTMGTDRYIVALKVNLWNPEVAFPGKTTTLMEAPAYEGTYLDESGQVQYSTFDGRAYTGTAFYDNDQYYFQNGAKVTNGYAPIGGLQVYFNADGTVCKDLEPLIGLPGSYRIRYNKGTRTMYVCTDDGSGTFNVLYKVILTTCGPDTPIGTFNTYAKYDWKFMHDNIYCQYLTRFKDGFLMHSLLYYDSPNPYTLDAITYNFMDDAVSGGCIRMRAKDCSWIYNNVPLSTPITIYSDMWDKGPVEADAIEQAIPREQNYDPTDPVVLAKQASEAAAAQAAADAQAAAQAAADAAAAAQAETTSVDGALVPEAPSPIN